MVVMRVALSCVAFVVLLPACGDDSKSEEASTVSGAGGSGAAGGMAAGGNQSGGSAGGGANTGGAAQGGSGGRPPGDGPLGSLLFYENSATGDDYALQLELPASFGVAELTFEIWVRPDASLPFGPTAGNDMRNWTTEDEMPYDNSQWWFDGNFLLDGHHNGGWADGSFDLQLYGSGRVRWLFGDGELRGVQAYPATNAASIIDGAWHHIATVRRASGNGAELELWVDGVLIATDLRPSMVDMRQWWDTWFGFGEPGWHLGAEKGSVEGGNFVEDFKGNVSELRFWSIALETTLLEGNHARAITGTEPGLVGWYRFGEGAGSAACDSLAPTSCFDVVERDNPIWSLDVPALD